MKIILLFLSTIWANDIIDTVYVDKVNSQVNWVGRKVTGEHSGYINLSSGWIALKNSVPISGSIVMDMHSITTTDIESPEWSLKLTNHLKNDDFFSVDSFPKASLEINASTYNKKNKQIDVFASLTIRGITNDISFPIQLESKDNIMIATGSIDINRTLFNIKYKSGKYFPDLGDRMIYDDFTILFKLKTITNKK
tara:strand:- start:160 stop:744 length:585 start_codon:yes stop_codon:yes gene_type:complete